MINELVNSILDAERRADEITREAIEKAAEISATAEREAAVIKSDVETSFRVEAARLTEKNDALCEELYSAEVAKGNSAAEKTRAEGLKKAEKISEEITGYILSGNY